MQTLAKKLYSDLLNATHCDPAYTASNTERKLAKALQDNLPAIYAWPDDDDGLQLSIPDASDISTLTYLGRYHNTKVYYSPIV